ncbi:MAG: alpha/beta fold hydrolase [Acidimicrobiia bacterium]
MSTTIALAHATGFCGAVWRPVVDVLSPRYATIAWDFPCHGSAPKLSPPIDWWRFGEWVRNQIADVGRPMIGVGHSMGGAALVMAEIISPGTFAALVLVEPMLFPPPYRRWMNPLAEAILKRRRTFDSRSSARKNFASKPPFDTRHPAALDGYIEGGLIDSEGGCALACSPEDESDIYQGATAHGAWEKAGEVATPTLVLAGESSDTHPIERVRAITDQLGKAGWEVIPGASHFLPMERPDLVARRIERMAAAI